MKKSIGSALIVICLILAVGCSGTRESGSVLLNDANAIQIAVSSLPEGYDFSYTDSDSIAAIVNYLSDLNLISDFKENPNEYAGMTWVISLKYDDGSELTVYHFGNMFIRAENSSWYKMSYKEASRFDTLLHELDK